MHKGKATDGVTASHGTTGQRTCPVVPLHERRRRELEESVSDVRARLLDLQRRRDRLEAQAEALWQTLSQLQRELHGCRSRLVSEKRLVEEGADGGAGERSGAPGRRAHDRWISEVFNRLGDHA